MFEYPEFYNSLIPVLLLASFISFLLTPLAGKFVKKLGLIDLPGRFRKDSTRARRIHKNPVLTSGGIAVIIPFVLITLYMYGFERSILGLLIGVLIILITGVIDDQRGLSSKIIFLIQWIAAFVVVITGSNIPSFKIPFDGIVALNWYHLTLIGDYGMSLPGDLITAFWIVLVTNAINWVNGSDGLAEGVSSIAAFALMLISVELGDYQTAFLAAIYAGAMLGFLPFNFYPAKIFSGAGGPTYGFILATLAIFGGSKLSTAILLLSLPLVDMAWVIVGRMRAKKTLNIFKIMSISDKTHLHHKLLNMGLNMKQVAYIEYAIVTIIATIAFLTASIDKAAIILGIFSLVLIVLIVINVLNDSGKKLVNTKNLRPYKKKPKDDSPESRYAY